MNPAFQDKYGYRLGACVDCDSLLYSLGFPAFPSRTTNEREGKKASVDCSINDLTECTIRIILY